VTTAEKYVTAAYLVVFGVVLLYLVIMAAKVARLERELTELAALLRRRESREETAEREQVPVA
jgi:CcmD family protein